MTSPLAQYIVLGTLPPPPCGYHEETIAPSTSVPVLAPQLPDLLDLWPVGVVQAGIYHHSGGLVSSRGRAFQVEATPASVCQTWGQAHCRPRQSTVYRHTSLRSPCSTPLSSSSDPFPQVASPTHPCCATTVQPPRGSHEQTGLGRPKPDHYHACRDFAETNAVHHTPERCAVRSTDLLIHDADNIDPGSVRSVVWRSCSRRSRPSRMVELRPIAIDEVLIILGHIVCFDDVVFESGKLRFGYGGSATLEA
ncbi:hypothetical protein BDR03DRAFT_956038 [Suillus americanus]|nr:hypothetical protein BDR03DRAFT_956038 [Suillus americanus]